MSSTSSRPLSSAESPSIAFGIADNLRQQRGKRPRRVLHVELLGLRHHPGRDRVHRDRRVLDLELGYRQGTTGSSIGKSVMKFKVISEKTGQPIGLGMSIVRELIDWVAAAAGHPLARRRPVPAVGSEATDVGRQDHFNDLCAGTTGGVQPAAVGTAATTTVTRLIGGR